MNLNTIKTIALTSAVALSLAFSGTAQAQTETVGATLIVSGALSSADVSDMDFGDFFIFLAGADTATFTMQDNGALTVAVVTPGTSTVVELTAGASRGAVTVSTPTGVDGVALTMTRSNTSDFSDSNLSLTSVEYATATQGNGNALNADTDSGTVTVVAGGTPEQVDFGGVITASATPANATHTASFDVTFAF